MDFTSNFFLILVFLFYLLLYFLKKISWVERKHVDAYVLFSSVAIYCLWYPPAVIILFYVIAVAHMAASSFLSQPRPAVLTASIMALLAPLVFFKYIGFLAALLPLGLIDDRHWILPLGLSFYVFTAIGYILNVYQQRGAKYLPLDKLALLISFWPHLAAGPILRASLFKDPRHHIKHISAKVFMSGLVMIVGGAAKKIFIADNLGAYVNHNVDQGVVGMDAVTATLTVFGFGGQIYADFSGYSEMALGFALLMGYRIPANFNYPYAARSITEFWHRWHISLSTWFRDFLYIPLGGNRKGVSRTYINIMVVFVVSGLWHGASVAFLWWGAVHGLMLVIHQIYRRHGKPLNGKLSWILTFLVVNWAWVFFRFEVDQAWLITTKLFDLSAWLSWQIDSVYYAVPIVFFMVVLAIDHWFKYYQVDSDGAFVLFKHRSKAVTYCYVMCLFLLAALFSGQPIAFIYFEF